MLATVPWPGGKIRLRVQGGRLVLRGVPAGWPVALCRPDGAVVARLRVGARGELPLAAPVEGAVYAAVWDPVRGAYACTRLVWVEPVSYVRIPVPPYPGG